MKLKIDTVKFMPRNPKNCDRRGWNASLRVYVWPQGETVIDNLSNRHSRPIKEFKAIAVEALKREGIAFESIRWSQKAGCACGCSPGVIVEGTDWTRLGGSLHVDVVAA